MGGHVARMVNIRNAYKIIVRESEEKGPLGRPRRRWEDNVKIDLKDRFLLEIKYIHKTLRWNFISLKKCGNVGGGALWVRPCCNVTRVFFVHRTRSSGKNLRWLLSFKYLNLCKCPSRNYKLIINYTIYIRCSGIVSHNSEDLEYYDKGSNRHDVCNYDVQTLFNTYL
jgi:hypothetical protein